MKQLTIFVCAAIVVVIIVSLSASEPHFSVFAGRQPEKFPYVLPGYYVRYADLTLCKVITRDPLHLHCAPSDQPDSAHPVTAVYDTVSARDQHIPEEWSEQFNKKLSQSSSHTKSE